MNSTAHIKQGTATVANMHAINQPFVFSFPNIARRNVTIYIPARMMIPIVAIILLSVLYIFILYSAITLLHAFYLLNKLLKKTLRVLFVITAFTYDFHFLQFNISKSALLLFILRSNLKNAAKACIVFFIKAVLLSCNTYQDILLFYVHFVTTVIS